MDQDYFQRRGLLYRKLFSNAPSRIKCRICKKNFKNPLFQGSSIITKVCEDCSSEMMPKTKKKIQAKMNKHIQAPNSIYLLARR